MSLLRGTGYDRLKRAADVAIAGAGLVATAPVIAVAALAVARETPGGAFFRQTRVGRHGVDFEVLKLRTMVAGAESMGAGYALADDDPRVTAIGDRLRRASIDELPQLWNVLVGEMSIVGPRPTLRYQVDTYTDRQRRRLEVRPGVTGWAQVRGRAALAWPERIELDVWYVDHRSLLLDLWILALTVRTVLRPAGVYRGRSGGWVPPAEGGTRPGVSGL